MDSGTILDIVDKWAFKDIPWGDMFDAAMDEAASGGADKRDLYVLCTLLHVSLSKQSLHNLDWVYAAAKMSIPQHISVRKES